MAEATIIRGEKMAEIKNFSKKDAPPDLKDIDLEKVIDLAIMNATGKDDVCGVNKTLQRKELEKEADKAMKLSDELERKLFID